MTFDEYEEQFKHIPLIDTVDNKDSWTPESGEPNSFGEVFCSHCGGTSTTIVGYCDDCEKKI